MRPIPGVPLSDFLGMFQISREEIQLDVKSGSPKIRIQEITGDPGNEFIALAHLREWINNPQKPAGLRDRVMVRVKSKMIS